MTPSEFIGTFTAFTTALYLIVTFFILLAALKANRHGQENAATADRRTQEALAMTRESNELTRQSIEIARRSLELSVRPSLHIGRIESNPTLRQLTFTVSISNKGGTAYDLLFLSGHMTRAKAEKPALDGLAEPLPSGVNSRGSLGRDEKFEDSHTIDDWNSLYHQRLKNGDEILYFFATATYRDILNHRHRTRFLRRFDPTQQDWSIGIQDESETKM